MQDKTFWKEWNHSTMVKDMSSEVNDKDTYDYDAECINCEHPMEFKIKKGIPTKEYLKGRICTNCGCQIIN